MKAVLVNLARCSGCKNCQVACKDEHCEQPWLPYAAAQPEIGQFWIEVTEDVQGQVPMSRVVYTPRFCGHCADAPCLAAATDGAVYRREEDGLIIIDPVKAKGQRAIAEACPIGAIYWNEALDIPQKCTGCAHLMDNGWEKPRCLDVCNTDALYFGEEDELLAKFPGAHVADELAPFGSRVYYVNDLKYFVGASVVDAAENEAIIGAHVALLGSDGRVVAEQDTDEFGEFQFMAIDLDAYTVAISAEGYEDVTVETGALANSVYLGEINPAPLAASGKPIAITGVVLDYDDEGAVPEAEVVVRTEAKEIVARAATDDEGRFAIEVVRPLRYQMLISHEGFTEEYLVFDATSGESVDLGPIYPDKDWKHPYTRK